MVEERTQKSLAITKHRKDGTIKTKYNDYQPVGVLLFDNEDNLVKVDSNITLAFGEFKVQGLNITAKNK